MPSSTAALNQLDQVVGGGHSSAQSHSHCSALVMRKRPARLAPLMLTKYGSTTVLAEGVRSLDRLRSGALRSIRHGASQAFLEACPGLHGNLSCVSACWWKL